MTNNSFSPITILWIEDKPLQEGLTIKTLNERGEPFLGLAKSNKINSEETLPAIHFRKNDFTDIDTHKFFQLKILQHPEEIKEFVSRCLKVEDVKGSAALGKLNGVVPEVVMFDYQLSDIIIDITNVNSIKYYDHFKSLREFYNPNHEIIKAYSDIFPDKNIFLEGDEDINYSLKDFIDRINRRDVNETTGEEDWFKKDEKELDQDELGLYAGGVISRMFRNHACIGIPATFNKKDVERMHVFSKFYEWMNEHDLGSMFSREERGSKNWAIVIPAAMKQLRIRIEVLIASQKVTPNLSQLMQYADREILGKEKESERVFTIQSVYGTRHLPLDGLFIDVEKGERDKAIGEWATDILSKYKTNEYMVAKEASENLIKAYRATTIINNRIRLSELVVKLCNNKVLTKKEDEELKKLKNEFGISEVQINAAISNKRADQTRIKNKVKDFRKFKVEDELTNRLIVLFTDLQLHLVWQKFCEMNRNSKDESGVLSFLKNVPNPDDLRSALFPIPENPLVLPYHYHLLTDKKKFKSKDPFDVWDKTVGRDMLQMAIFTKTEYPIDLSDGEIQLCKSFALEIGIQVEYPVWLFRNK